MTGKTINENLASLFEKARTLIDGAEKILLATHKDPDADGVGSMLALHHALRAMGKQTALFTPTPIPINCAFLSDAHKISSDPPPEDIRLDAIIGLDYGSIERLEIDHLLQKNTPFLALDHHWGGNREHSSLPPGSQDKGIFIIAEYLSSTAELVYLFLKHNNFPMSQDTASALLAGIFADTGGFQHTNTTETVLRAAGDLISRGASLGKISRHLWGQKEDRVYRLWARALQNLQADGKTEMVYSFLSQSDLEEFSADVGDTEGLPSIINKTRGSSFSLFLTERENGKLKGSLRSEKYKKVNNVASVAEAFGGGGHRLASGFETDESALNLDKIIDKIQKHLKKA